MFTRELDRPQHKPKKRIGISPQHQTTFPSGVATKIGTAAEHRQIGQHVPRTGAKPLQFAGHMNRASPLFLKRTRIFHAAPFSIKILKVFESLSLLIKLIRCD
jgi:hypothetical protein